MFENLPFVAVIVPVRRSQANIPDLIEALLGQDYPTDSYHIYLVGNVADPTWSAVPNHPQITMVEDESVPAGWPGRDSNWKRNAGAWTALRDIRHFVEVLAYTDAKIRPPSNWISQGVQTASEHLAQSVAGEMLGTPESAQTFWGMMADRALIRRNPHFGEGFFLSAENFGDSESHPIGATWLMSREFFELLAGYDGQAWRTQFNVSYEDIATAWWAVAHGLTIWCTSVWSVYHKHRSSFREVALEYERSGEGAGQFWATFPKSPFSSRRLRQVIAVSAALILTIVLGLFLIVTEQWLWIAAGLVLGTASFAGLGVVNSITARHWYGLFFPFFTAMFILVFTFGFVRRVADGGGPAGSNRGLQISSFLEL